MASKEPRADRNPREHERCDPTRLRPLRTALAGGGIPIDELAEDMKSARALIQSGEARLEVVAWPWGLEFHLVAA
jgi:hypothetical protein